MHALAIIRLLARGVASGAMGLTLAVSVQGQAAPAISGVLHEKIDEIATSTLSKTGVPSASVVVVVDGQIAYRQAFGSARIDPLTPARSAMRYAVGSVSKQFTAAATLMLAEQGKLSLDDKVSRFLPGLVRADEVTIRELLSHTSGYQDYWPQDYVMTPMLAPTTAAQIMDTWAKKPLDFDPGTQWQYSNTNYVIAGRIVEMAAGMAIMDFLGQRIFTPLGMHSVADVNAGKLGDTDATGYYRHALGPLRRAPKEGPGWLFAAGELAMSADDLARWDIGLINGTVLSPASTKLLTTEVKLLNGTGTHYGLGIALATIAGRQIWEHSGEVSGFTSENIVAPDARIAVVVLTNQDASDAAGEIGDGVARIVLRGVAPTGKDSAGVASAERVAAARAIFVDLQHGHLDRSRFTSNANDYFSSEAIGDFSSSLGRLGPPRNFCERAHEDRGGMVFHEFIAVFAKRTLTVTTYEMPDGKLEQYLVFPGRGAAAPSCST